MGTGEEGRKETGGLTVACGSNSFLATPGTMAEPHRHLLQHATVTFLGPGPQQTKCVRTRFIVTDVVTQKKKKKASGLVWVW